MSKVRGQLADLTRHLFEQHQATKTPAEVQSEIEIRAPRGGSVSTISIPPRPYSRPLAPGVHPMMGPVFVPGIIAQREVVTTREEAMEAVERAYAVEHHYSPETEEDVPSIDAPPEVKKYSRKLEP